MRNPFLKLKAGYLAFAIEHERFTCSTVQVKGSLHLWTLNTQ
mgnify:CR=1 FL=1